MYANLHFHIVLINMNLLKIKAVLSKDSTLSRILNLVEVDFNDSKEQDIYLSLIRSVLGQQLSVKAAKTIYERFLTLFDDHYPSKEQLFSIDVEALRSKGLSKQKAAYVKNIAVYFSNPEIEKIDWTILAEDEIIKRLTSIKGVGKWTVEMLLMFTLNRSDVFPNGDLAIQNGMKQMYQLEDLTKKELLVEMEKIAENWRPYRSYATRYIWAAKDLTPQ